MSTPGGAPRQTVLVASDGSPAAATAIPLAHVVAHQLAAMVEILHVTAAGLGTPPEVLPAGETLRVRANGREPATGIVRAAAESDVALLVMATHGRAVEPGRELGRVAQAVIAHTSRPVLLVHPETQVARHETELRHLLLPVDLTPTTAAALAPAAELACRLGAAVDLLYVATTEEGGPEAEAGSLGSPRYVDQPHYEWPEWAREVMESLASCVGRLSEHVPVHLYHAHGDIGAAVVRFAEEHHEDAVVLVRRSQMETGRARVLRQVLAHTPCPVLLVGA